MGLQRTSLWLCGIRSCFAKTSLGYEEELRNKQCESYPVVMKYHKEEVADVGSEMCYVKHCGSTRCAFVKSVAIKGDVKDLMYIYEPMGLDRQADEQGGLLARFQSRSMAACFLYILDKHLDMKRMDLFFLLM